MFFAAWVAVICGISHGYMATKEALYEREAGGCFSAENHSENAWNPSQECVPKQSGTAQARLRNP